MTSDNQEMQVRQRIEAIKCERDSIKKFREYIKFLQSQIPGNASLQLVVVEELSKRELDVWLTFVQRLNEVLRFTDSEEAYRSVAWQEVLNYDGIDSCQESFRYWLKNQLSIIETITQELAAGKVNMFLQLRESAEAQKQELFIDKIYN